MRSLTFEKSILFGYAALLAALFFLVPRESGFGPGGVLTAILSTNGHPNPPGYQTIGIIGNLWNSIPHSNPFLHFNRLGFLIACATLAAAYCFFQNYKKGLIGTTIVGLLLVSMTFQKHLFFFDRYMLACFFMFLAMNEALKIEKSQSPISWVPLGAYLSLGFLSHLFGFVAAAAFALIYIPKRRYREIQSWVSLIVGFWAGLLPVFWSVYKGYQQQFFNWGEIRNWHDLLNHILRSERGPLPVLRSLNKLTRQLDLLHTEIAAQFSGIGMVIVIATVAFLAWNVRDRMSRGLLFAGLSVAALALATTNFSLGAPGSGLEKMVGWFYSNYFLYFHVLIAVAIAFAIQYLVRSPHQKILAATVLILAAVSIVLNFKTHSFPEQIRKTFALFPGDSVVLTQTDSLYFPLEASRLNNFDFAGPVIVHLHLLARPWYLRSLQRDGRLPAELNSKLHEAETAFNLSEIGVASGEEDHLILLNLINDIISHYESKSSAYVIEFEDSDPIANGMLSGWTREPWGIGERLFKDNSEVKEITWPQEISDLLKAQCHPSLQIWCTEMGKQYRLNFEKRRKFIQSIFPSEAAAIKTALHP